MCHFPQNDTSIHKEIQEGKSASLLQEKLLPHLQHRTLISGDDLCRAGEVAVFLLTFGVNVGEDIFRGGLENLATHLKIILIGLYRLMNLGLLLL